MIAYDTLNKFLVGIDNKHTKNEKDFITFNQCLFRGEMLIAFKFCGYIFIDENLLDKKETVYIRRNAKEKNYIVKHLSSKMLIKIRASLKNGSTEIIENVI